MTYEEIGYVIDGYHARLNQLDIDRDYDEIVRIQDRVEELEELKRKTGFQDKWRGIYDRDEQDLEGLYPD